MTEHDDIRFDEDAQARGGLRGGHLLAIGVAAIALLAALVWMVTRQPGEEKAPQATKVETVPEGSRNVTLFFAGADDPVIYGETRELAVGRRLDEQVRQVIDALVSGPSTSKGISAIPPGTQLFSVMVDADSGTVYLDFSSELVAAHPGGSAAEYCTIASIVRSVGENFPEVLRVQILVDGSQVETIAGHVRADQPFPVKEWR